MPVMKMTTDDRRGDQMLEVWMTMAVEEKCQQKGYALF
jgi:hypothetical protein